MKFVKKYILLFAICISFTNSFSQIIDPTSISFVSINPYTNEVSVSWYKSESPNISFVRVHYIYDETTLVKAKTIQDIPVNLDDTLIFKTESLSIFPYEAIEVPLSFAADAYSTNGDNSTSLREYHTTMHCEASFQNCPSQIIISWTPYYGYEITVSKYQLVEITGTNTETVISEFPATTLQANIGLNNTANRNFFIRAIFNDCKGVIRSSTSNKATSISPILKFPTFINPENISVNADNDIEISFSIDTNTSFTNYKLYRAIGDENLYTLIDSSTIDNKNISPYTFTHSEAFKNDTILKYRLIAFDNCNVEIIRSISLTPISLKGIELEETKNLVQWSTPDNWTEGVSKYTLYRITNNTDETKIYEVANGTSFIDDLTNSYKVDSKICYRVEALQDKPILPNTSLSNTFCFQKDYKISIPNALNPYSKIKENTLFKPKYAFVSGPYSMKIYNRFGDCVFESTDIEIGWDGKIKDIYAPQGSYQYKITIQLPSGETINRVGCVNVVYN